MSRVARVDDRKVIFIGIRRWNRIRFRGKRIVADTIVKRVVDIVVSEWQAVCCVTIGELNEVVRERRGVEML
jgi:hypothetical protein